MVYPWQIQVIEDVQRSKLSLEITGIPNQPPFVGEEFDAYIYVNGKTKFEACDGTAPESDVIRVQWDIYNGPTARVTVKDMKYHPDTGLEEDERQQWTDKVWQNTCSKINTMGCDVLTVKLEKPWLDWEDTEDVDFNGKQFDITLKTELNSVEETF